ncbi:GNAT family N-acetyltransferase [Halobacteriales archaeon QS_9_68_42]|nr:MAG: GNAT family N-acetyltransferase [Halobacteriales archaeon QS_9_68_42]
MNVREATTADGPPVRSIALRSMEASYSLSPSTIENAIRQWYGVDRFAEKVDDDDVLLLVVEEDGETAGFSESVVSGDRGDIHWLHVAAMYRGQGLGRQLYEETRERLGKRGAETIRGLVLADNSEGNRFWENQGLTMVGEGSVEIDGNAFVENVYVDEEGVDVRPIVIDGNEHYIDRSDVDRGSEGPFYTVYIDEVRENKYGYYCGACENLVTSMDAMGRLECKECGNALKPSRWDAAYM